jgi:hypothetical protein
VCLLSRLSGFLSWCFQLRPGRHDGC